MLDIMLLLEKSLAKEFILLAEFLDILFLVDIALALISYFFRDIGVSLLDGVDHREEDIDNFTIFLCENNCQK